MSSKNKETAPKEEQPIEETPVEEAPEAMVEEVSETDALRAELESAQNDLAAEKDKTSGSAPNTTISASALPESATTSTPTSRPTRSKSCCRSLIISNGRSGRRPRTRLIKRAWK